MMWSRKKKNRSDVNEIDSKCRGCEKTFNEVTFDECEPLLKILTERQIDFVIFGGFAVFLQMIKFNQEVQDIFDVESGTRITEDIDVLSKSVQFIIEVLKEESKTGIILDSNYIQEGLTKIEDGEDGMTVFLNNKRGIDILSCIQGYSIEDMEYDIVEYRGYSLKIATVETLMDMKTKLIETYGDGARDKDKSDLGLLGLMFEKKNEGGLKW